MTRPSTSFPTSLPGPHNIADVTLDNGLRVLVYENFASETVVINGDLLGGAIAERPDQAGLANLTAAMLRRGTLRRSFDEINETIEAEGASFGFGSGRHVLSLGGRSLSEDVDLVLELLAESLTQPAFDQEQLEQMRARILTGIHERAHSTRTMASLNFRQAIYPSDHPYHAPQSGYEDTVSQIGRDDLTTFFRQFIAPANGVLVMAGAIAADEAIAKIERTLGQWSQPQARPVRDTPPRPELSQTVEINTTIAGKSQSDIVLGWPGIERTNPDYFPLLLCNNVLGRFGMGGRLGYQVREKQGMAYYAYSSFGANRGAGTWYAAAGVNPKNITRTIQTILREIERIRTELVTDEEIADVKAKLTGSLPLRLETNGGIAGNLLDMAWYDLGLDYLQRYAERVQAVSKEDILRVALTYLDPDRYVLAIVGPEKQRSEVGDQSSVGAYPGGRPRSEAL
jgi:zinc protease